MPEHLRWREGLFSTKADRRLSSRLVHRLSAVVAHSMAGVAAGVLVGAWIGEGLVTHFPHWWEVTLYSVTSAVTFVVVFVIQHTQSRQVSAIQRKLDELVRSTDAGNAVIGVEDAPDRDLAQLAEQSATDRREATADPPHTTRTRPAPASPADR
jgi:low affinity Fe/Cu permease